MSNHAMMFPENFSEEEDDQKKHVCWPTSSAHSQVVMITGSNQGIGFACVSHFAKEGYMVIGTARTDVQAKEVNVEFTHL